MLGPLPGDPHEEMFRFQPFFPTEVSIPAKNPKPCDTCRTFFTYAVKLPFDGG